MPRRSGFGLTKPAKIGLIVGLVVVIAVAILLFMLNKPPSPPEPPRINPEDIPMLYEEPPRINPEDIPMLYEEQQKTGLIKREEDKIRMNKKEDDRMQYEIDNASSPAIKAQLIEKNRLDLLRRDMIEKKVQDDLLRRAEYKKTI